MAGRFQAWYEKRRDKLLASSYIFTPYSLIPAFHDSLREFMDAIMIFLDYQTHIARRAINWIDGISFLLIESYYLVSANTSKFRVADLNGINCTHQRVYLYEFLVEFKQKIIQIESQYFKE